MKAGVKAVVLLGALAAGCSRKAAEGGRDPLDLPTATDVNPDPDVVEVDLVAEPGEMEYLEGAPTEVWGYRDANAADSRVRVPGPMIEAKVGDEVIVHFRNDLPEETTIHWHGIRLPNGMDGSNTSQNPIPAGGTFEYRFVVQDAGSFWYHPHLRGDVQIERGLYAPLVVRGGVTPEVAADRYFVLDDVKLESDGSFAETTNMDEMTGKVGNVLLVNGVSGPSLDVTAGTRERWRFVNVANGRFFNLTLPDHSFLVIGWDGGVLEEPYEATALLLAPGERYEVLVDLAGEKGGETPLQTIYYDRGHDLPDEGPKDLVTLRFTAEEDGPGPLPTEWGSFEPLLTSTAGIAVRSFSFTEEMMGGPGMSPVFFINGEAWPNVTPTAAALGATEIWDLVNESEMDHPFHLHGVFFQVLDRAGVPETRRGNKDTVIVPMESNVRVAVRYSASGNWVYHCHILEHAELGMMGSLLVSP